MEQLENDFPSINFVYMTDHTDGNGLDRSVAINNQQIRDYYLDNSKILFDFEDIESYDPDGNYFGNKFVRDDCSYHNDTYSGNWAIEWQNAHPGEWYDCESAHSQPLNANMKAYATWWLWAYLAGWNDTTASTDKLSETSTSAQLTIVALLMSIVLIAVIRKR